MNPAFQTSFIPPSDQTCARVAPRAALGVTCEVRQGTRAWQRVILEDLSATGFRIRQLANPDPSKPLWIRIPGIQLLTANLCWAKGSVTGCKFTGPLHVAVFEHLVRNAGGELFV